MERQAQNLDRISNIENLEEFPSAAEMIKKLEMTVEKLTKENQELLKRKGKSFVLDLKSWSNPFELFFACFLPIIVQP